MNKGRERGEWLEAKGMAGARRYGRMWLGDPSSDSRQGDSSSVEVYLRQGSTLYKDFCIFSTLFPAPRLTTNTFRYTKTVEG
jgi:hypothetical protein